MSDKAINRIAVLTSGGDAPGMNAAIRSVVRASGHFGKHVYGIYRGYDGMIKGSIKRIERHEVGNIIHRGGTILKTARSYEFFTPEGRQRAYETLKAHNIDACIVIGGNGTYTAAMIFSEEFDIPMIGIPGTIDNDIFGTDFTIGFDTALNTAIDAVDKIRDTADSHNRVFFIEVMGRHTGHIALHTGIGSGATGILIPENNVSIEELVDQLRKGVKRGKLFSLVIVAEGNKNGGAAKIAESVAEHLPELESKVSIIGHLQRGGAPSCHDRVLASRLGASAVTALLDGKTNKSVGIINDEIVFTEFSDAISADKSPKKSLIEMTNILS
ncbi:6-phosphofructokinase [Membranicola marinus]|uniref:ATP-dependent 6-phosphofructokinase n=1 Tax=Membranihabitans marinus TaxID=1227546 RepID=A0A953HV68_9BACT|nr:6-phosphofructokinase [Membranihabitans marinus]MBY5958791.1 6-phosphofructokinase [Membranihabitans marinus]